MRNRVLLTLQGVQDEEELNEELVAVVEAMLESQALEGLLKALCNQFPTLSEQNAEDALGASVAKLITLSATPERPDKYLAAMAYNEMKAIFKKKARESSLEALAVGGDSGPGWDLPDYDWSIEERTQWKVVYDSLTQHVKTWDVENMRVVTLLYLESAYEGFPLPSEEAAELTSEILGYDVDANAVRSWKSRGYRELQKFVQANGLRH